MAAVLVLVICVWLDHGGYAFVVILVCIAFLVGLLGCGFFFVEVRQSNGVYIFVAVPRFMARGMSAVSRVLNAAVCLHSEDVPEPRVII